MRSLIDRTIALTVVKAGAIHNTVLASPLWIDNIEKTTCLIQNNRGPLGYRSAKSPYARKGRSAYKQVKAEIARFKKLLNRPSFLLRSWACFRQFWQKFFAQKNTD